MTRAKSNLNAHRVYSATTDRTTGVIADQRIGLDGRYSSKDYPVHLRRVRFRDRETEKTLVAAARTVKRHWDGILQWFESKIANGLIEGLSSLVQAAKAKARGYRSTRNLKAIIYLLAGKLDMQLPAL